MNSGVRNQVSGVRSWVSGRRFRGLVGIVLAALIIAAAGSLVYFAPGNGGGHSSASLAIEPQPVAHFSIPLFFEPNHGQTDAQVKFLARGSGYGLFLTADEAVLKLQRGRESHQPSAVKNPRPA